jgi:hypothetical protein
VSSQLHIQYPESLLDTKTSLHVLAGAKTSEPITNQAPVVQSIPWPLYMTWPKSTWHFFLTGRHMGWGMGCMWPWTSVPPALTAQSMVISQNLLLSVLCMSHWQWPRKLSSTSAWSFVRNLDTHAQKPTIWSRRLFGMSQQVVYKSTSGLGCSKIAGHQLRVMNIQEAPPWKGTNWWFIKYSLHAGELANNN